MYVCMYMCVHCGSNRVPLCVHTCVSMERSRFNYCIVLSTFPVVGKAQGEPLCKSTMYI